MSNTIEIAEESGEPSLKVVLPLTGIQTFLWFHQRIDSAQTPYNIGNLLHIHGELDIDRFTQAHHQMLKETDCLRIRFSELDNLPYQSIAPYEEIPLKVWDFSDSSDPQAEAQELLKDIELQPFNLLQDSLYRFGLVKLGKDRAIFFTFFHHLIIDAVGGSKIFNLLENLFENIPPEVLERSEKAPVLSWMYAAEDFQRYKSSEQWNVDEEYWKEALKGLGKSVSLSDQPLKRTDLSSPGSLHYGLDRKEYERICQWGLSEGRSAYIAFATAGIIYLSRATHSDDVCIGTPNSGRNKITRNLIGMLANATPLRVQIADEDKVEDVLKKASRELRSGLRHTQYPYGEITLNRRKENLEAPFSLIINYLPLEQVVQFGAAKGIVETLGAGPVADMEIHIFDRMDQGPIDVRMDFNLSRYSRVQAEEHLERYIQLLKKLPDLAKSPVAMVTTLLDQEKKDLFDVATGPDLHYETIDLTIPALFAKSVRLYPDNPAILYEADGELQSITYAELDQRSNRMARFMISQKIGPECIVGILLTRSPDLLVCILATLKAGAAYLPIDPDYPADRIEHMLRDSEAQYVISTSSIYQALSRELDLTLPNLIAIDDATFQSTLLSDFSEIGISDSERMSPLLPKNLAYVIYTSGSTGKPKGVSVPHAGVINTARAKVDALKILAHSRVMQFASHAFDGSVQEIFSTLSTGATLVLSAGSMKMNTIANLEEFLHKFSVTHVTLPPALVKILPDKALEQLDTLLLAGEECTPDLVRRLASQVRLLNAYGPTEVTVNATMSQALDPSIDGCDELGAVSIGKPIANVSSYVLDQYLELTPNGKVGELYITGIGVTRGYLNKPGLTAERFLACPFGGFGERMYRTGDLVRRRTNADLEYVGRVDHQVKVRGFRIELGEIEAQILKNYPQIAQAIVILYKENDDAFLVAYLVSDAAGVPVLPLPNSEQLRETLAHFLPDYMIPSHFQYLDSMPLTVHGKVDRKALPAPQLGEIKNDFEAPINETEKILCRLFGELVGIDNVGVNDDFFHIGGHSLLAIKLIARFKDETGASIPMDQLFEHATPKILASLIESSTMKSLEPALIKGMGRVQ